MGNRLFFKLAKNNIWRNRQMYIPYALATTIMSAMFFIISNLTFSRSVSNMRYGETMVSMMAVGIVIMAIFTISYMLYLNSFLMKRRKKEFGLYGVLGLEKRHVMRIVGIENIILNAASLGFGILCGTVFGKLIFMALMATLDVAEGSRFTLAPQAYILTVVIFLGIFVVTTLYNQLVVRLANPIDLINGSRKGEKKMRATLPVALLGAVCLGTAYWASMVTDRMSAIIIFWPAVVLVIIGTYCIFTAGSQVVLRALKKNSKFYYKPRNFIAVSGLRHRMRQNAAGLSNICILSTMVLVTISCVFSLYLGQESALKKEFPNDAEMGVSYDRCEEAPDLTASYEALYDWAAKSDATIDEIYTIPVIREHFYLDNGQIYVKDENGQYQIDAEKEGDYGNYKYAKIIALEDFNRITNQNETLQSKQLLLVSGNELAVGNTLLLNGVEYSIKSVRNDTKLANGKNAEVKDSIFFVAASREECYQLSKVMAPDLQNKADGDESRIWLETTVNYSAQSNSQRFEFSDGMYSVFSDGVKRAANSSNGGRSFSSIDISREGMNSVTGGLLFLGVFFALLFLVNTVLIMYFKQVSEGYEDREKFVIMQKVGLSDEEVRSTINSQVRTVFLLPIIVALVHILAATNIMRQIMSSLTFADTSLLLICITVTSALFTIVYLAVFKLTARTYYKIVKW
ncbi:MAG: ABC transporter permease [Oscillospiraceae bacterium]